MSIRHGRLTAVMMVQGMAADWAREKLETGFYEKSGRLQRINTNKQDPGPATKHCTKVVTATGFKRNALPDISMDGRPVKDIHHDRHSGAIIPGKLYGFGIAFPEEVIDPEFGHKENNIGLWKFMRYTREALPAQKLCAMPH